MRLAVLIHEMLSGLSFDDHPTGSVTLHRSRPSWEGTEADQSYYLTSIDRVIGKRELVMGEAPPPNMDVEVVVTHDEGNALKAYRRFGVREVWVCKESGLTFLVQGARGRYVASPVSACLAFLRSDELAPWVYRTDPSSETRLMKLFRAWVAETLVPRRPPAEG
jgi:hypothetical protein